MPENKLGLGTVQFGLPYGISNTQGQTSAAEVAAILQAAATAGIDMLDTAAAYGTAETVLGANDLSPFKIVSKYISPTPTNSVQIQLQHSLRLLGVRQLYGYLAHRPAEILTDPQQWQLLEAIKAEGLVEKIGFSLNTPQELEALLEKGFQPDLVQVPYNYFDHRFEKWMLLLKEQGCEVHTRSAFLQGLFFREADSLPAFFAPVKDLLRSLQQQTTNLSGALLQYVVNKPFIDKVIIGVETAAQLQQNISQLATAVALPPCNTIIPEQIVQPFNWPKA